MNPIRNNILSFKSPELKEMGARSVLFACPGLLLLGSVRLLLQEIHPQFGERDSVDQADSTDFIITTYDKALLDKVASLFIEKLPKDLRTADLQNRVVTDLTDFQTMVLTAAHTLKCQKIAVGFSFCNDPEALARREPYTALGGRTFSYFSDPLMKLHLNVPYMVRHLRGNIQTFSSRAKAFISSHEVSHIASNHNAAQSITSFVYGLFNTILWQQCWSEDYSFSNIIITALIAAFVYQLFFFSLVRHQEKQADLMACDALGSNQEALEFCEAINEMRKGKPEPVDLAHPPIPERIAYLKAWKKKEGSDNH